MKKDFKKFANSFQAIARLRLEGISCLMKHLGNPQNDLKFIHVAGTNGKGSVCSFLQCIFTEAGYRTGKYTSPNLISVCERISIDGKLISEADINRILEKVEAASKKVEEELGDAPTQFEIWTAAAFCYFKEQGCDLVILETGLGGSRDATNVIAPPLASVITRIDIDHTEYLGNTIEEIAGEKAGIIKKGCPLTVTVRQTPKAARVLEKVCAERENRLVTASEPNCLDHKDFCEIFSYTTSSGAVLSPITCGISGLCQPENAGLAAETAHLLGISPEHIKKGISLAKNPGRFEVISQNPDVIYDGAHNKNGMEALIKSLKRYYPKWQGGTFIMAFMADKDIRGELELLQDSGLLKDSEIFVVKVKNNPRSAEPLELLPITDAMNIKATAFDSIGQAYLMATKKGSPTILCGSLYLYKDFAEALKEISG